MIESQSLRPTRQDNMTIQTSERDSLMNRFVNGALAQLQEEFYLDKSNGATKECYKEPTNFDQERNYCQQKRFNALTRLSNENTIFERVKAMVMKKKEQPKTISLHQKSQIIIDDTAQFRMLKQKMQSSGMVTNEGIQQMLPSIIDSQYKEVIDSQKKAKKQKKYANQVSKSLKSTEHKNLRSFIDHNPSLEQSFSSSICSQQHFNLFPGLFPADFRNGMARVGRGA